MIKPSYIVNSLMIGAILLLGLLYYSERRGRLSAEQKFYQEKKEALRKQRDSAHKTIDSLTFSLEKTTDSLRIEEQNIKYRPYEKLMYVDRDVDSALDTIAKYRFNP